MMLVSDLDIPPLQLDGKPGQVDLELRDGRGGPHLVLLCGLLGSPQGNAC